MRLDLHSVHTMQDVRFSFVSGDIMRSSVHVHVHVQ